MSETRTMARGDTERSGDRGFEGPGRADPVALSKGVDRYAVALDVTRDAERVDPAGADPDQGVVDTSDGSTEQDEIRDLRKTDLAVRAEQAVTDPFDALLGLPMYDYRIGPDGRAYAMGEGVKFEIDASTFAEPNLGVITSDPIEGEEREVDTLEHDVFAKDGDAGASTATIGSGTANVGAGTADTAPDDAIGAAKTGATGAAGAGQPESDRNVQPYIDATVLMRAPGGTGGVLLDDTA